MVACQGRALRMLSEQWPVVDGDEAIGPIRAMNETSRVVAENQIRRLPVVENDRLVGMVSLGDIATHYEYMYEASEALTSISLPSRPQR